MVSSERFGFKTVSGIRWPGANTTAFTYSQAVQGISAVACPSAVDRKFSFDVTKCLHAGHRLSPRI